MAYGRLDVFWPDGRFESYLIDNGTTTVGRSSGCTIVLDTDTISRYHFSLTLGNNDLLEISDMDSANGTFVDGVRLEANDKRVIQGGEEIQIGFLRMIYHRVDAAPTLAMDAIEEETQRFLREDVNFHFETVGPEIAVPPGSYTSIEIRIHNTDQESQRFTLKLSGLPNGWARVNRAEPEIEGGDSTTVLVNIKPYIHSDSKPGEYPLQVVVALKEQPEKSIRAEIPVQILPYVGMGMALATTRVKPREKFRLHLHNQSSIGLPLALMGRSPDEALRFTMVQTQLVLAPGQRYVAQGDIVPIHRRMLGKTVERSFHIMARSRDEASFLAVVPGTYVDAPLLSSWTLLGIGVIGATLIALVAAALLLISQATPPPEVLAFGAESLTVKRGEPLILTWEVENTDSVTININDAPVALDVPPETGRVEVDTSNYSGEISVAILAQQGAQSATSSLTVGITEPLVVEVFEVEPATMARNVVQTLSGRWRVFGATETRVEGLDALGPVTVDTSYGPEGSFEVSGLPTENFSVILVASDDDGNTVTQSVTVNLFDPVCTTIVDNLNLFAAPSELANVISTLALGQPLVVDARSQDGNWLRTSREGIATWGPIAGLRCEESFNPANLYVDPTTIEAAQTATSVPTGAAATRATPTETPDTTP